ncbi:hypothetical protein LTR85_007679 [Meristemomyces frigidus]|nr:hypothetical protein LTR85_007679 [Meristemomyces frigidus]
MATKPFSGHMQFLKYFVDTAKTKDEDAVARLMQPSLDRLLHTITKAEWMVALQYAEDRIEPVEVEINILASRIRESGKKMGYYRNDGSGYKGPSIAEPREKRSLKFGADAGKENVVEATKKAIAAFWRVKEELEDCERALEKVLDELVPEAD